MPPDLRHRMSVVVRRLGRLGMLLAGVMLLLAFVGANALMHPLRATTSRTSALPSPPQILAPTPQLTPKPTAAAPATAPPTPTTSPPPPTPSDGTCVPSMGPIVYASGTYDSLHQQTVVFGGERFSGNVSQVTSETWLFDACWHQVLGAPSPPPRSSASMVYDAKLGLTLLFGGEDLHARPSVFFRDAWSWDGKVWTQLANTPMIDVPTAGYDQAANLLVVVGVDKTGPNTWTFDGSNWIKAGGSTPPVRKNASVCYDSSSRSLIVFGGSGVGVLSDTWSWSNGAWVQLHPAAVPPARTAAAMLCGAEPVLFGGTNGSTSLGDFWLWTGVTWRSMVLSPKPAPRFGAIVSSTGSRGILSGGVGAAGAAELTDTWAWDGTKWNQAS